MKKNNHYCKTFFEIFLLISMSIAVSYIIKESSSGFNTGFEIEKRGNYLSTLGLIYKGFIKLIFSDKNFVSAATPVYTCLEEKDGSICQEFVSQSDCSTACKDSCVPSSRDKVSQCKLGTCYDKLEGTCQPKSPKAACEAGNGEWNSDPNANIPECKRGCCVIGEQTFFATTQECSRKASVLGMNKEFRPEVDTELACLILSNSQEEGACVFEFEFENTCKYTTKGNCLEIGGDFNSGLLCSNPELKTNCEPQKTTGCAEDKDGIYWYDSCGNRENIYYGPTQAKKEESYNDGRTLPLSESCELGTSNNPLANQATCGNCNYLVGSRCGEKTSDEKLSDSKQEFVCRDLRCKTDDGKVKLNGESWCAYNSAIGLDKGTGKGSLGEALRSIDTPGSRHFRQVCIDGEIRNEACADYRNEICVEAQSPLDNGKDFSSAACRINKWQQCLAYNNEVKGSGEQRKQTEKVRDDKCDKNSDCFIKQVNIDKNFKFNICAPKYPAGFDLSSNPEASERLCSLATQKCTVVYVKTLSGWTCKANCNCRKAGFAEQMNDLCMSLGDCGASVNYQGDYTENIKVTNTPKLSSNYIA